MARNGERIHLIANGATDRVMDVVFVHGLGGDLHGTWTSKIVGSERPFFWPAAMAEDLSACGIWSVEYAAPFTAFASNPGMTIDDRAANLALRLCNSGLGVKPIVFVMHSLGGLVVKSLCVQSQLGNGDDKVVASSIRGLVFCGTPHRGSGIATATRILGRLSARHVRELEANTDRLNRAHRDFLAWHKGHPDIAVQTYYETRGFAHRYWWLPVGSKLKVVSQTSADTGVVGSPMYPVSEDHIRLVKPHSRDAEITAASTNLSWK